MNAEPPTTPSPLPVDPVEPADPAEPVEPADPAEPADPVDSSDSSDSVDPDEPSEPWPLVSVIVPALNEERHLRQAVTGVLTQDYPGPIEVVLALGPCTDATPRIAAEIAAADHRVVVVDNPSGRTPDALNAALAAAHGDVVARLDGHAQIPASYLRVAVRTLRETGADNVGGIMDARGETAFERAVACAMRSPLGVGGARFHVGGEAGESDTVYLGVFDRAALHRVGGYDPHFDRAQDWEMNHRIRASGGRVWFTPQLRVLYRPRSTVRRLAAQYHGYGRWRRVVARLHPGTVNARYLAPPAMVLGTSAAAMLGMRWRPALLVPAGYLAAVTAGGVVISRGEPWSVRVRTPLALAAMHWSWGTGFLTSPRSIVHPGEHPVTRETTDEAADEAG